MILQLEQVVPCVVVPFRPDPNIAVEVGKLSGDPPTPAQGTNSPRNNIASQLPVGDQRQSGLSREYGGEVFGNAAMFADLTFDETVDPETGDVNITGISDLNTALAVNEANVILSGAARFDYFNTVAVNRGTFELHNQRSFTTAGDYTNDGGTTIVDSGAELRVAGDLTVTGTMSGSTSITGTTNASWNIGSATDATAADVSVLFGQTSGQESLVFDGDSTDDFLLSDDLQMLAQADLRFADSDSSNYVAFQGPATVSSNVTWTLPSADGSSGQILSTDGSGTLSWASDANAGGTVTSITEGTGMSFSVTPITSTGTINLATDSTLTHSGAWTLSGNWVNTANPWADNEVSDTLTASVFKGSGSTSDAVDLATAEVSGLLPAANITHSLDDAYDDGQSITVDTANVVLDLGSGYGLPLTDMDSAGDILILETAQSTADRADIYVANASSGGVTMGDLVVQMSDSAAGVLFETQGATELSSVTTTDSREAVAITVRPVRRRAIWINIEPTPPAPLMTRIEPLAFFWP